MNTQKLTQKSLEAIQAANGLAVENQNQQIEQVHLLSALLEQEGGLIPQLFEKMGVSVDNVQIQLKNAIDNLVDKASFPSAISAINRLPSAELFLLNGLSIIVRLPLRPNSK